MISGRKYQVLSGFMLFTRRVKSIKQAKFRLPDIQSVYLKKPLILGEYRVHAARRILQRNIHEADVNPEETGIPV